MFDPDDEPPAPPLAMDVEGIRAERARDSGPVTRRRDSLDERAGALWSALWDRVRLAESVAYAAGVEAGRVQERTRARRRSGRPAGEPPAALAAALLGAPPRTAFNDLHQRFAAVQAEAEEFGRTLAAAVRDVFDAWEAGQSARQRMEVPRVDDLITDGRVIQMGDECLVTRPVLPRADEEAPPWPRPVLTSPKPWPRARLEWRVRDELERLLRAHEVPFARARGDVLLPPHASAEDLQRTFDAGACVRHLAESGGYAELGADLVEAFVLGGGMRHYEYGLTSMANRHAISTSRYLLAAWHPDAGLGAAERRVLVSTRAYRRGSHDRHARDAVHAALLAWPLPVVECPTGIDAARWRVRVLFDG